MNNGSVGITMAFSKMFKNKKWYIVFTWGWPVGAETCCDTERYDNINKKTLSCDCRYTSERFLRDYCTFVCVFLHAKYLHVDKDEVSFLTIAPFENNNLLDIVS
jgi:hypothetical protein